MWALLECMLTTLMLPFQQLLYLIFSQDLKSQINSDLKYIDRWLKANKSQCRQNRVYGY